jgi:hypothetical protein
MALGWLRDLVIVVLVVAGIDVHHNSPVVGGTMILSAAVIFAERFLWTWHLCDLRDSERESLSSDPQ